MRWLVAKCSSRRRVEVVSCRVEAVRPRSGRKPTVRSRSGRKHKAPLVAQWRSRRLLELVVSGEQKITLFFFVVTITVLCAVREWLAL